MIKYPFFDILAIVDELTDGGITMARTKKYSVHLSEDDVKRLKILIHKKDTSDTIFNRCRILMDLDEEHPPVLTYQGMRQQTWDYDDYGCKHSCIFLQRRTRCSVETEA